LLITPPKANINTYMEGTLTERLARLETALPSICKDITEIKNNHLHGIEQDIKALTRCTGAMKTDLTWLKKFFWVIATTSLGGLIAQLFNL